jgi:hypothetical protein
VRRCPAIYRTWCEPLAAATNASLLFALSYVVALSAILRVTRRRRIFLRVWHPFSATMREENR